MLFALVSLVFSTMSLQRKQLINDTQQLLAVDHFVEADKIDLSIPEVRFAYAWHLAEQGLFDQAVEAYSKAELNGTPQMLKQVYYNMGNLYLTQAIDLAEKMGIDRAMALADVAKDMYESALKIDDQFWNAKFNLEAAQRLSRDLPLGRVQESEEGIESSTELWSAMPGFPIGLP
jgi:mxaK protein